MQSLGKIGLMCVAAALSFPMAARADGYVTPWIGAGGASSGNSTRASFGVTSGYMGAGVFGFEGDFAYAPEFFGAPEIFGSNNALTGMGNFILGIPFGGTHGAGVRPFVSGGLGIIRTHIEGSDLIELSRTNTSPLYNVGTGIMGFFNDHVGVRGDVRYLQLFEDTERGSGIDLQSGRVRFWRVSAGMTFR